MILIDDIPGSGPSGQADRFRMASAAVRSGILSRRHEVPDFMKNADFWVFGPTDCQVADLLADGDRLADSSADSDVFCEIGRLDRADRARLAGNDPRGTVIMAKIQGAGCGASGVDFAGVCQH